MSPRSHEVTRLEAFSDAVFGFALTLLVVTLEVPKTSEELSALVRGTVPFAVMFSMVCYLWWEHNKFFRRFGLQDAWTAFLNSVLLFVVLFYIYPLKYLTNAVLGPVFRVGNVPRFDDARYIMALYSVGVVLIFGTFVLLYRHAWGQRNALGLSGAEEVDLRYGQRGHLISLALGVSSLVLIKVLPLPLIFIAGIQYALMGPLHGWNGYQQRKAKEALDAQR